MKLIDADALLDTLQKLFDIREKEQIFAGGRDADVTWNDAIYHIKKAPTIDAVPVIRCKDCKYAKQWRDTEWFDCTADNKRLVKPTGFCSWAERK